MSQNTMHYKGYTGVVEYSEGDRCFVGEVVGLARTVIGFHGQSVAELQEDFENSIESYLDACAKIGEKPELPHETEITVAVPVAVYRRLHEKAERTGKSVSDIAVDAFKAAGFGKGKRNASALKAKRGTKSIRRAAIR